MDNYPSNAVDAVGTLHLDGEDAARFLNSLYHPSTREIEERRGIRERIGRSVSTADTDYGFQATVNDLDLSSLDGATTRRQGVRTGH